ncbi:single-stranded DNA-binding protein [Mucilaginibacter terrae]|uniref:single-stranded DNA-binding protein n=1 Tax=Mucilaginibacter terrae TaxID=1955052 RepID=UPI00362E6491
MKLLLTSYSICRYYLLLLIFTIMFNNAGINKVFLVGHVCEKPQLHQQADGHNYYSFLLATSEFIKKNNQLVEHTERHQVIIPTQQLTEIEAGLDKGHLVYVEGKIKTYAYTGEQGIKHYRSEILSSIFRVLSNQVTTVPDELV